MTPEIQEILKKISSAKGLTVLLVVVFLSIFVWKNLDFLTEISFTFKNSNQESVSTKKGENKKEHGVPRLELGEIILPPIPVKLPSVVVFEVKNPGTATVVNAHISIDYGAAKVISYEVLGPRKEEYSIAPPEQSIITIELKKLRPNESVYIYAHTSFPSFKRISLSSENVNSETIYTYNNYLNQKSTGVTPTFNGFLFFLLGGFILVMTIFSTAVLISKLNKWLKLGW